MRCVIVLDSRALAATAALLAAGACAAPRPDPAPRSEVASTGGSVAAAAPVAAPAPPVTAPAAPPAGATIDVGLAGWEAHVLLDNAGVGVWTVKTLDVIPPFAGPEIVALDDKGRCHVIYTYSGRIYDWPAIDDREWLGGLWLGQAYPKLPPAQLYTGGKRGNLFRVQWKPWGTFSSEALAHFDGEIYTIAGGDFDPSRPGIELLVFLHNGNVHLFDPAHPENSPRVLTDAGRVRDAAVFRSGDRDQALVASRDGTLGVLGYDGGWSVHNVSRQLQGMGRIAAGPWTENGAPVFFAGCDDGSVLRIARSPDGPFSASTIYLGRRGVRGVAPGRLDADAARETVAIFGYGTEVELLSRGPDGRFSAETIFVDKDKGHWLYAGDVDARSVTDELFACGFGGRLVQLSRPPGYGRSEPVNPGARAEPLPTK